MSNSTTADKVEVTPEQKAQKRMERAYSTYKNTLDKAGQSDLVISYEDFVAARGEHEAKEEAENTVVITPEITAILAAMGWEVQAHTRKTGGNLVGKTYDYLVNSEAAANGTGFMKLNKGRLQNMKDRLTKNLEAIEVVLEAQPGA